MRNYSNIPVLDWGEKKAALKAKAQILHQEPVILQMPDSFKITIDAEKYGCEQEDDSSNLYDCEGGRLLKTVAIQTQMADLESIADACIQSSSRVDIDRERQRIIVHD